MEIQFYCPHWGSEDLLFDHFIKKVTNAGYLGVEMSLPMETDKKTRILGMIREAGLNLIAQHWETVERDFVVHKNNYERRLRNLCEAGPVFVNAQTGKDYFSFEQNEELIDSAREISQEYGIRILHETHRGKFSFAAHVTRKYLERIPDLRLTLDISHWFNVAESTLEDQEESVRLAVERSDHIHSRIGFNEGPQVNDPAAPEWKDFLDLHLKWWDAVIKNHADSGNNNITITTEFGPTPYMPTMPFSRQPLADQWQVNLFMKNLLEKRYAFKDIH